MRIFNKIPALVSQLIASPIIIINWTVSKFKWLKEEYNNLKVHLDDLKNNNIKLGRYHLEKGNFKDAKFRFWLINKLYSPKDPENFYWYGWTYLLNGEYQEAKNLLYNNSFDTLGLFNYLESNQTIETIPRSITETYLNITKDFYDKRYSDGKSNLIDIFLQEITPYLNSKNDGSHMSLLEIRGVKQISQRLEPHNNNIIIDRLEFFCSSYAITEKDNSLKPLYNRLFLSEDLAIDKVVTAQYDMITAFDSLSTTLNLATYLKQCKNLLTTDGIIALALPLWGKNVLDLKNNSFQYQLQFIEQQLTLADFRILRINEVSLLTQNIYCIIIAT